MHHFFSRSKRFFMLLLIAFRSLGMQPLTWLRYELMLPHMEKRLPWYMGKVKSLQNTSALLFAISVADSIAHHTVYSFWSSAIMGAGFLELIAGYLTLISMKRITQACADIRQQWNFALPGVSALAHQRAEEYSTRFGRHCLRLAVLIMGLAITTPFLLSGNSLVLSLAVCMSIATLVVVCNVRESLLAETLAIIDRARSTTRTYSNNSLRQGTGHTDGVLDVQDLLAQSEKEDHHHEHEDGHPHEHNGKHRDEHESGQHHHKHEGEHQHDTHNTSTSVLRDVFFSNVLLALVQLLGSLFTGSLSLQGDAGHTATDAIGYGLSWWARHVSRRPATHRYTYGLRAVESLVATISSVGLLASGAMTMFEAITRFEYAASLQLFPLLIIALLSIVLGSFNVLRLINVQLDHTVESALQHEVGDLSFSIGVLLSATLTALTGWWWLDAVIAFLIADRVMFGACRLLRETIEILLRATPTRVDPEYFTIEVEEEAKEIFVPAHVKGIPRIACTTMSQVYIELQVEYAERTYTDELAPWKDEIARLLREKYQYECIPENIAFI